MEGDAGTRVIRAYAVASRAIREAGNPWTWTRTGVDADRAATSNDPPVIHPARKAIRRSERGIRKNTLRK